MLVGCNSNDPEIDDPKEENQETENEEDFVYFKDGEKN